MERPLKYFDDLHIGDVFPKYDLEITSELADKYFVAIDEDPYIDETNGKTMMPPTFASVFATGCYKKFIENPPNTLHTKQEYKIFQPLHVGDNLKIQSSIVDKFEKKGNNFLVFKAIATIDNELALISSATLLWGKQV